MRRSAPLRLPRSAAGAFREQHRQQAITLQPFEAGHAVPGQEQLEHFLEQAGRGRVGQQPGQARDRLGGGRIDVKAQLGRQAHRAQHAHRVFLVTQLRIADQLHLARLHVVEAAGVVAYREVLDGVIKSVAGEVAADRVVLDGAVDVVTHQHAVFHLAVAAAVIAVGRKVATSMISRPNTTWARRKRRPISRQLRNSCLTCSGVASVATSKSLGRPPTSRSRTAPPTR
jgi:hypothetical protein